LERGGIGNEWKGLVGGGEGVAVAVEGGRVCSVAGWGGVGSIRVTDPTWVKPSLGFGVAESVALLLLEILCTE
jgi:hypothetical protein